MGSCNHNEKPRTVTENESPTTSSEECLDPGDADNRFAGLCVNCDQRLVCRYDRPEGGVWHCEDYR